MDNIKTTSFIASSWATAICLCTRQGLDWDGIFQRIEWLQEVGMCLVFTGEYNLSWAYILPNTFLNHR